ncbi:DEAD/DEAH box helicase [Ruania zhangjianzhongii]|uniref:DEAD/DEAH box helicase n=1 Tax=Ruania zhangjianzhongii TaxID=2603206 RepID=UPI001FCFAEEF|nr:DEAD/DEAH box helicase [Ruania zhangjianzhongii]
MSAPSSSAQSFIELGVPTGLVDSLAARGIDSPFPIQSATLADTLAGRDVLGRGRTGSGKTLAFSLPMVANLTGKRARRGRPLGLVLAPTRELASQIGATLTPLAQAAGLRTTVIFGGVGQGRQVEALNAGVEILIACPGRLEDLRGQGHLHLDAVEITVLDEADHMADLGFLPVVRRILDATPAKGQRMLFSATLDRGVDVLVKRYLDRPLQHSVDPESSPVTEMTHHILEVGDPGAKRALVEQLASGRNRRLLFTRTKHQARKLARQLTASGIPAVDLHGNLSQNARERNLDAFSTGAVRVLVATDIAARGIHVDEIDLVVHVDPPAEHKAYLHRSGRTARAGSGGTVVTIMLSEQRGDMRQLLRAAKISARPQAPSSDLVDQLVGEVAPRVAPENAPAAAARKPAPAGQARSGGNGPGGRPRSGQGGGGNDSTGRSGRSRRRRNPAPAAGAPQRPPAGASHTRGGADDAPRPSRRRRSAPGDQPRYAALRRYRGTRSRVEVGSPRRRRPDDAARRRLPGGACPAAPACGESARPGRAAHPGQPPTAVEGPELPSAVGPSKSPTRRRCRTAARADTGRYASWLVVAPSRRGGHRGGDHFCPRRGLGPRRRVRAGHAGLPALVLPLAGSQSDRPQQAARAAR